MICKDKDGIEADTFVTEYLGWERETAVAVAWLTCVEEVHNVSKRGYL